jgi:hypothetical protein
MTMDVGGVHPPFPPACPAQGLPPHPNYDPFAGTAKAETIATARELLLASQPEDLPDDQDVAATAKPYPCCGGRMIVIEIFRAGSQPQHASTASIDTS